MLARTALPESIKVATVSQEFIRRYKNTSRLLGEEHINEVIEHYISDLRRGGFQDKWILNVLDMATTGYMRMLDIEANGGNKVNRDGAGNTTSRRYKKLLGKTVWFKQ